MIWHRAGFVRRHRVGFVGQQWGGFNSGKMAYLKKTNSKIASLVKIIPYLFSLLILLQAHFSTQRLSLESWVVIDMLPFFEVLFIYYFHFPFTSLHFLPTT